jgi:hypothetical protein
MRDDHLPCWQAAERRGSGAAELEAARRSESVWKLNSPYLMAL